MKPKISLLLLLVVAVGAATADTRRGGQRPPHHGGVGHGSGSGGADQAEREQVQAAFVAEEVVPDVTPTAPSRLLHVTYPTGSVVNLGNELTPLQANDTPTVQWSLERGCSKNTLFTLFMLDPDGPSRANPLGRSAVHWVVANIPGNDLSRGNNWEGYHPPGPPAETGLHRYVILLYKQTKANDPPADPFRARFNATQYAVDNGLEFVPYAGNYFQAQYQG